MFDYEHSFLSYKRVSSTNLRTEKPIIRAPKQSLLAPKYLSKEYYLSHDLKSIPELQSWKMFLSQEYVPPDRLTRHGLTMILMQKERQK